MTRYLVTGASGLLGINFCLAVSNYENEILGVVHNNPIKQTFVSTVQMDLTDPKNVDDLFIDFSPDVILHCAAIAHIDKCEQNPELAWSTNAVLPAKLAAAAKKRGIRFLHISTDAIFDGLRGGYTETDTPNPPNVYARSKYAGEQMVMQENPDALITRVNFYGWSIQGTHSLAEWFYYNLSAGKTVNGFTDLYFSPLFVGNLVEILLKMISHDLKGIYHVASAESLNKYDFGVAIAKKFGFKSKLIRPVSWKDSGLQGARSPNLSLCVDKLRHDLGEPIPGQAEGMHNFYLHNALGVTQVLRSLEKKKR